MVWIGTKEDFKYKGLTSDKLKETDARLEERRKKIGGLSKIKPELRVAEDLVLAKSLLPAQKNIAS